MNVKGKEHTQENVSSEFSGSFKRDKNYFDKYLAGTNKIKPNEGTNIKQKVFNSFYKTFGNCLEIIFLSDQVELELPLSVTP